MEDNEIVELFLHRDETAISRTMSEFGPRLFRLSLSIVNDRRTAEECVNDVYLKAWNSIPPNEPRGHLLPYLLRMTRQISINRLKHDSSIIRSALVTELTHEMEECIPLTQNAEDDAEAKELADEINAFLCGVSREKRDMFVKRYWLFRTVPEIAKELNVSESKVKTTLFRLRRDLKDYLKRNGRTV